MAYFCLIYLKIFAIQVARNVLLSLVNVLIREFDLRFKTFDKNITPGKLNLAKEDLKIRICE
jgi:hypothetical protein